jgi:hypothetical protein
MILLDRIWIHLTYDLDIVKNLKISLDHEVKNSPTKKPNIDQLEYSREIAKQINNLEELIGEVYIMRNELMVSNGIPLNQEPPWRSAEIKKGNMHLVKR